MFRDYVSALRPVTILQAVGGFLVGFLALVRESSSSYNNSNYLGHHEMIPRIIGAAISVYLAYGAGMVMNDLVDIDTDTRQRQHDDGSSSSSKQTRSIASGRITPWVGWIYCVGLSLVSLLFAAGSTGGCVSYVVWTLSNLLVMIGYAPLGLQKVLLVKNIVCGWLAVSPLVGATLLFERLFLDSAITTTTTMISASKLVWLAAIGFPLQVAREILKDIEDIHIDRGIKSTLPLLVGEQKAHFIAYSLVGLVCGALVFTPFYWRMFYVSLSSSSSSSSVLLPIYPLSVLVGIPMCIRASVLPLHKGQLLFKKSIYVLLAGMIGGLLVQ